MKYIKPIRQHRFTIKMTSREVAEIAGKRHADVIRDIKDESVKLGGEVAESIFALGSYKDTQNQERSMYNLSEDGALQLGARYDAKTRFTIIKRIRQLEEQQPKLPGTYKEALLALVEAEEEKEKLQLEIKDNAPRVSFAETIEKAADCILIRDMSKILSNEGIKLGEKKLYSWYREKGLIMKNSTKPTQRAVEMNIFNVIERVITTVKGDRVSMTTKLTGKGQIYTLEKIKKEKI